MIVLGVDTSTEFLSVALIDEKKTLVKYDTVGKLNHSKLLIPTIKKSLAKARKKAKDIGLFAVGMGPGSFTGLRVGLTAVRALAIALNKPIIGVPTMDAIAYNGYQHLKKKKELSKNIRICTIIDAKKNQVYACIYRISGDKIIRKSKYLLEPAEDLIKKLNGEILFLGDGAALYKEKLLGNVGIKAEFIEDKRWFPRANIIAEIGLERFRKGKSDNPYDLEPMYLYARDCNVRKV
ncbi:MAG: tRNA (adenosine(37)-N6)-threonylcarbamoyltransferase complex dimerization subunit type 1 TsaB [Candidatus Omnitrophica bacterium]|nr:tRNA (adenosine(37)-N6)-threonylcarbamoyltransferase complex dimerization subunit type 1 TsaB [Candidatus Omnitrophota bacterium]